MLQQKLTSEQFCLITNIIMSSISSKSTDFRTTPADIHPSFRAVNWLSDRRRVVTRPSNGPVVRGLIKMGGVVGRVSQRLLIGFSAIVNEFLGEIDSVLCFCDYS